MLFSVLRMYRSNMYYAFLRQQSLSYSRSQTEIFIQIEFISDSENHNPSTKFKS